ncbi:unnamed protein product [Ostreobium quekettii]|uniref:FAD-binding domain-containing protein n=1 Tax=Ostreobium quekettii TaxID=121088 RepID=A0A8S1JIP8_9CHLO|nr:unnamed protein product [Ostreobium quekettii]|eukprot:evm.model.scf_219.12 EVM.evm.TU.scf_219.12   scf_219:115697-117052(+)
MGANGAVGATGARRAVVVGCGPVGSLAAIYLARTGWRVEVFEVQPRYEDRLAQAGAAQRAYTILLGPRGKDAINGAGASLGRDRGVDLEGYVLHRGRVGQTMNVDLRAGKLTAINRDVLGWTLQQHGAAAHADRIQYYFGHRLTGLDFEQKVATFEGGGGDVARGYDLLVGADGVWSGVRAEMAKAGFLTFQQHRNVGGIKVVEVDGLPGAGDAWGRQWHMWVRHSPKFAMLGSPTPAGRFRLGIGTMTRDWDEEFGHLRTEADVAAKFESKFPDLFGGNPLPEGLARDLLEQRASHNGVATHCSAFHGGGAVLVGDAAHSMWLNRGQGCNSGLESARILSEVIEEHGGDLAKALPAFTAARKPDTDAAVAMSKRPLINPGVMLRGMVLWALHRALPFAFGPLAEDGVADPRVPYSRIEAMHRWQDAQLAVLAAAGAVGLACLVLRARLFP